MASRPAILIVTSPRTCQRTPEEQISFLLKRLMHQFRHQVDERLRRSQIKQRQLKRRIDEASKHAPLEQLCLSPQCGFSSTVHGNNIAVEDQRRKLALVVETAREVWG